MKRLYIAIGLFILLLVIAILGYFFNQQIIDLFTRTSVEQNFVPAELDVPTGDLSKEQQKDLLDQMAPEDPIDTQEEFDEQIKLLDQLQAPEPQSSDLDRLNALQGDTSVQEQLELLEQLQ